MRETKKYARLECFCRELLFDKREKVSKQQKLTSTHEKYLLCTFVNTVHSSFQIRRKLTCLEFCRNQHKITIRKFYFVVFMWCLMNFHV